jgi:thiol-disulfide isomerase/thioredoxin
MPTKTRKERGQRHTSKAEAGGGTSKSRFIWGGAALITVALLLFAASRLGLGGTSPPAASVRRDIAAPDFRLTVYRGAEVLGAEELEFSEVFSQGKPVVLNFWAGLCPPCRAEMPSFQKVYDDLGDQFILLGVDIGPFVGLGSREDAQRLLRELNITYPTATTPEANVVVNYKVRGMPTTVFLTPDGEIVETHVGFLDEATLRDKLQDLFQVKSG